MNLMGSAIAQNGFNMPYSQFGVGLSDLPYTVPLVSRMGGVVYTTSGNNFINPFNPASYGSIGMESFVFDMAANIQLTRLQNNADRFNDADGNVSHLMFGLPITKWWKAAAGLLPYSSVDYESVWESTYLGNSVVKNIYDGTGGASLVFLGSAFNIINNEKGRRLQAGFNIDLLVGRIQRALSYSFQGIDSTHYMDKRRYKETKLSNLMFDLGVQYWEPLSERYTFGVGLTYKPYRKMNLNEEVLIYTYHASDQSLVDTIFPSAGQSSEIKSNLELDHTFGLGLSLARNNRWMIAADATFSGWAGMKYTEGMTPPIFGASSLSYGPYSRYALALHYCVTGERLHTSDLIYPTAKELSLLPGGMDEEPARQHLLGHRRLNVLLKMLEDGDMNYRLFLYSEENVLPVRNYAETPLKNAQISCAIFTALSLRFKIKLTRQSSRITRPAQSV